MLLLLAALAGGCATRTRGTENLQPCDMVLLDVPHGPAVSDAQGGRHRISAITIDGESYAVDSDRAFWLTPGRHEFKIAYLPAIAAPADAPPPTATLDAPAGTRWELCAKATGAGSGWKLDHCFVRASGYA
jgi:hypothetical protein